MSAIFPTLKTGAVTQYPATKSTKYSSFVVRFLDGSDQRHRQYTPTLLRWSVKLALLDESETRVLEQFFLSQGGQFGTFVFVDPWTKTAYPNCSFDQSTCAFQLAGESQGGEPGDRRKPNVDALLSATNVGGHYTVSSQQDEHSASSREHASGREYGQIR